MTANAVVAIFVGGESRRMGTPKGRLAAPDTGEPLVGKLVRIALESELEPVLVGAAEPYADLVPHVRRLVDDPVGIGPLGGLRAALLFASERSLVALACDMPFIDADDLRTLVAINDDVDVLAARRGARHPWEPFLAHYRAARVLPTLDAAIARGERSFQALFAELRVAEVSIRPEALLDWDAPDVVPEGSMRPLGSR